MKKRVKLGRPYGGKPKREVDVDSESIMFRKNLYITKAQRRLFDKVYQKYGKSESQQVREALCLYFEQLGYEL